MSVIVSQRWQCVVVSGILRAFLHPFNERRIAQPPLRRERSDSQVIQSFSYCQLATNRILTMSAVFNFTALPFLARRAILKSFGFSDLLRFASLSRKALILSKCARLDVKTLSWKFTENQQHCIELDDSFKVVVDQDFATFNPTLPLETMTFGILQVKVFKTETCWFVVEPNRPAAFLLDVMDHFTRLILSFCQVQKYELETAWKMDIMNLFIWQHTRALEYFRFPTHQYSGLELEYVLQNINVRILELSEELEDFKYSGALTMDTLLMASGAWITEDNLKQMKCKKVVISGDFSPAQCHSLIRLWIDGHLPQLEMFTVETWFTDTSRIFQNIRMLPWNPKKRPETFKYIDVRHGMDVQRADGTLATCSTWVKFHFVIWHPKFL